MDTLDKLIPRKPKATETVNNPDAEFNPEAVAANPGLDGLGEDSLGDDGLAGAYADDEAPQDVRPGLKRWQIIGLVAGGVALAAGAAGLAYLRLRQANRPQTLLEKMSAKIDLAKAQPRRLSQMAGRRIEQLPVRQVQKRVADRVTHLFD